MWICFALAILALIALLFGFEYLGSEQPRTMKEIPVAAPAGIADLQH